MKHFKHLFISLLLLCSVAVSAHEFEVNGIYYNITSDTNKTVEVTYKGYSHSAYSNEYTGDVVIPESVTYNGNTYSVTSIEGRAFEGCSGLTSVVIPNSVTSIGYDAFYNCSGLTSIVIPNSVTSIGNYAFNGCTSLKDLRIEDGEGTLSLGYHTYYSSSTGKGLFYDCPLETLYLGRDLSYNASYFSGFSPFYNKKTLKSVTIGNSVTSIGGSAFNGCSGLTSIEIPNSVTSIGNYAFNGCSGLTSVEIPNSVTSIGDYAFYNCSGLTSVVIGNSVTSIGESVFLGCSGLTSIEIPNSVTSIGNYAFNGCSGLTSVVIPNSVTSIGNDAFNGCTSLKNLHIEDGEGTLSLGYNYYNSSSTRKGLFYDCPLETLYLGRNLSYKTGYDYGYSPFYGKSTLKSLTIGNSVTSIGSYAFDGCSGLTSIEIPNSVTNIGESAFDGCSGLTSIVIGNSVTSIGDYAFYNCSGLTSIVIPNSVTSIGSYAFYSCYELTSVVVADGNAKYDSRENCNAIIETATNALVAGCKNTIIPNSVTSIGSSAFYGCFGLTSIEIPNSVTSIESSAFEGCSGLTSVVIGNSVTSIGERAFRGCNNLKTVINFSSLTITKGSNWGGYVGYYADKVINAPNGTIEGDFVFGVINRVNTLVGYLGNDTEIVLPDNYSGGSYVIGTEVFYNNTSITSVVIPNSVTSIGESAFNGCTSLKDLHIEDGEGTLSLGYNYYNSSSTGKGLFYDCPLETLYLGRNLSYKTGYDYGYSPFYGKSTLKSLTIGNSVTSIGSYAFDGCSGLKSVVIGNSVTSIGSSAFEDCSGLTSIVIPNSVTSIGDYAFYYCSGLKTVINYSSSLTITTGGSNGYVGYYADNVINAPNGVIEGDFAFCVIDEVNTLAGYFGNDSTVVLPDNYKGESYAIGKNVFYNNASITSIEIPNSITSIGDYAFSSCSSLTAVYISDLSAWCNIDFKNYYSNPLYYAKNLYLNGDLVTHLVIPNVVTEIKKYVFNGCNLTSIVIPNSVTSIGNYAFNGCKSLKNLHIEDGEDTLSLGYNSSYKGLFYDCPLETLYLGRNLSYNTSSDYGYSPFNRIKTLASVTIGNSVTSIGSEAFGSCSGLTSIVISNSVTSIGDRAFEGCSGLTSIEIPNSVTSIGDYAFNGCTSLKDLRIEDGEGTLALGYNSSYKGLFYDCPLETLYLGRNLSYNTSYNYGYSPFYAKRTLTSVTIGNSVTSIGSSAFSDCSGLTSVVIGNSVTSIGNYAFRDCSGLTSIVIPNSVTSIGSSAFEGCSGLTSIEISNSIKSIGNYAFYSTAWYNNHSDGVVYAGKVLYKYKGTMPENTSIIVEEGTFSITVSAFEGCSGLTSIVIPNSVTSIGNYAFRDCSGLTSVVIGNSVTSIGNYAFNGCWSLKNLRIEDGEGTLSLEYNSSYKGLFYDCPLETLYLGRDLSYNTSSDYGYSPFYAKSTLTSVTIGNCVTSIGENAFQYCYGLKTVINLSSSLTITKGSSSNGYVGYYAERIINVENGSIENDFIFGGINGTTTLVWYLGYDNTVVLPDSYNNETYVIGAEAFYDKTSITNVTIPYSVTGIKDKAFYNCSGLEKITSSIPAEELFAISTDVFYNVNKESSILYVPYGAKEKYATTNGWKDFVNIVEVDDESADKVINLNHTSATIYDGDTLQLLVTPTTTDNTVIWITSDKTVAIVDENGLVRAVDVGTAKISAVVGNSTAICEVTVEPPLEMIINISEYGSATYCSKYVLDFSNVKGLKAYAATGYKANTPLVILTRVQTAVGGMGLFLKGEPGEYIVPVIEETDEHSLNLLVGTLKATTVNNKSNDGRYVNFKYTVVDNNTPVFYQFNDGSTLSAYKAYLQIPTSWLPNTASKSINIHYEDDETTDIDGTCEEDMQIIHDLSGRRINDITDKGVYIINGKKVIK